MTATTALTAAPPHAIRAWVDPNSLYFELPSQNGPCVLSFPRTSAGFSKALAVLFVRQEAEASGQVYLRPPAPQAPNKDGITEAQRQAARETLKRMKIT